MIDQDGWMDGLVAMAIGCQGQNGWVECPMMVARERMGQLVAMAVGC